MPSASRGVFTNPTTPWGAAEILNVDGGQSLRVSHGLPWYRTSDYPNLGALWAAAGAGPYNVVVNSNIAVTANLTFAAGIHLMVEPDFQITVNNGVTFTVYSPEHVHAGPRQWIFNPDVTGAVAWTSGGRISATWFASFAKAVASAGVGDHTILVPTGQIIAAVLITPANVQIEFTRPGATLQVNNGVTLTIYSPEHIRATPRQQLFALVGTGLVAFTRPGTVYPGWWGARADGVTDDIVPMRAADAAALASGSILMFPPGVYLISATWEITGSYRHISGYGATIQTAADVTALQLGTAAAALMHLCRLTGFQVLNVLNVPITSTSAGIRIYKCVRTMLEDLSVGYAPAGDRFSFGRGIQCRDHIGSWFARLKNCYCRANHVGLYGSVSDMVLAACEFSGGRHGIVFAEVDANNDPDLTYDQLGGCSPNVTFINLIVDGQMGAGSYGLFVGHSGEGPTILGAHFESINGTAIQIGFTSPTNKFIVRGGAVRDAYFASSVTLNIAIGGAWWGGNVDGCRAYDLTAALVDAANHSGVGGSNIHIGENYVASTVLLNDPTMFVSHSPDWRPVVEHTLKVADYPVLSADNGKLFSNATAGGPVTFTLPHATAAYGSAFGFIQCANQTMLVAPLAGQTIQGLAASEAFELRDIGDTVWIESAPGGSQWHIRSAAVRRAWRERGEVSHNYGGAAVAWVLTFSEASGVSFVLTNANGAASVQFPAVAGVGHSVKIFTLYNNSGFNHSVKVVGGVGAAATNGKRSIWVLNGNDCQKIYEQP